MTLHSSGLFSVRTASGCIDNALVLPVSPSLPDEETLAFVATIHLVRGSEYDGAQHSAVKFVYQTEKVKRMIREGYGKRRNRGLRLFLFGG